MILYDFIFILSSHFEDPNFGGCIKYVSLPRLQHRCLGLIQGTPTNDSLYKTSVCFFSFL